MSSLDGKVSVVTGSSEVLVLPLLRIWLQKVLRSLLTTLAHPNELNKSWNLSKPMVAQLLPSVQIWAPLMAQRSWLPKPSMSLARLTLSSTTVPFGSTNPLKKSKLLLLTLSLLSTSAALFYWFKQVFHTCKTTADHQHFFDICSSWTSRLFRLRRNQGCLGSNVKSLGIRTWSQAQHHQQLCRCWSSHD